MTFLLIKHVCREESCFLQILKEACAGMSPGMGTRNNFTAIPILQTEQHISVGSH